MKIHLIFFFIFCTTISIVMPIRVSAQHCPCNGINPPDSLCLYYRGLAYDGIDPLKERDTMMAYCEQHPFATSGYGRWVSAINDVQAAAMDYWTQNIQQHDSVWSWNYWANMYDWYAKVQPLNSERVYQDLIVFALAGCASNFDNNLAANLFYNYSLLFSKTDSAGNVDAWEAIRLIRRSQSEIPEDTTPFYVMTFPLQPLLTNGVSEAAFGPSYLELFPNPASKALRIHYELDGSDYALITIFDATGREVKSLPVSLNTLAQLDLDVSDLPNGLYFVRLGGSKGVITKELVIQH